MQINTSNLQHIAAVGGENTEDRRTLHIKAERMPQPLVQSINKGV